MTTSAIEIGSIWKDRETKVVIRIVSVKTDGKFMVVFETPCGKRYTTTNAEEFLTTYTLKAKPFASCFIA